MSKYQPLTDHLRRSGENAVPMTFEDIERVIGAKLPPSAANRPWWSNNPTNNVMTRAWRAAGYESARVDMKNRALVFRRVTLRGMDGEHGGVRVGHAAEGALGAGGTKAETNAAGQPAAERDSGRGPDGDGAARGGGGPDWFAAFHGGLRGTVTIAPGVDLTDPVAEEWDAERDR